MTSGGGPLSDQLLFAFDHEARSGFQDFMPAASNQEALSWIARWPDWQAPALILHGPKGAGKSHLAAIWAARSQGVDLGDGLGDVLELDASRSYLIDPAEPVLDEMKLLQLYNRLREDGGSMLLTATKPALQWAIKLPDLRSRLAAAPSVVIGPPDDQLLAALFLKLFDDRQLSVPEPVIRYLLTHMERSFAKARELVDELDRLSLSRKQPITIPLARLALEVERGADKETED